MAEPVTTTPAVSAPAAPAQAPAAPAPSQPEKTVLDVQVSAAAAAAEGDAAKPAEGDKAKPAEGDKAKPAEEDKAKPAGAPEKYEDFSIPEGFKVDPVAMEKFNTLAKEANLDQATAQKFISLQTQFMGQVAEAQAAEFREVVGDWLKRAKEDTEYGGQKYEASVEIAKTGLKAFATPELVELMNTFQVGNHPEIIRVFYRIGRAVSEGNMIAGQPKGSTPTSLAERIFPNVGKS